MKEGGGVGNWVTVEKRLRKPSFVYGLLMNFTGSITALNLKYSGARETFQFQTGDYLVMDQMGNPMGVCGEDEFNRDFDPLLEAPT